MKIKTDSNAFYLIVLLLLSVVTHFYAFGEPEQVVFDEVHFGKYVSSYCCTSQRIFDIHPPHAKILIAYTARLFGYQGEQNFSKISNPFPKQDNWSLRLLPTIAGTLFVPIIFILMIQLHASQAAAFFASLLILFDTALLTQSRFLFLDSILLLAIFSSISLVIWASNINNLTNRMLGFMVAGALAAIAVGTKFTGLVALALPFLFAVGDIIKNKRFSLIKEWGIAACVFIGAFIGIYLIGWFIHFSHLNQPGPGDIWGILEGNFFDKLQKIHITMFKANANLTTPHHDASMWWGWPFMHNPIYYWNGLGKKIYLIGNPLVWWTSFLMLLTAILTMLLMRVSNLTILGTETRESKEKKQSKKEKQKKYQKSIPIEEEQEQPNLWFPLFGYCVAFLPLVLVSRPLFLYHYFTPLIFSILFVVLWLDKIAWFRLGSFLQQRISVYVSLFAVLLSFVLLAPLSYGLSKSIPISDFIFSVFPLWR